MSLQLTGMLAALVMVFTTSAWSALPVRIALQW
jgi:hypothetical protein